MFAWLLENRLVVLQWTAFGLILISWLQRRHQVVTSIWGRSWSGNYRFDGTGRQPE